MHQVSHTAEDTGTQPLDAFPDTVPDPSSLEVILSEHRVAQPVRDPTHRPTNYPSQMREHAFVMSVLLRQADFLVSDELHGRLRVCTGSTGNQIVHLCCPLSCLVSCHEFEHVFTARGAHAQLRAFTRGRHDLPQRDAGEGRSALPIEDHRGGLVQHSVAGCPLGIGGDRDPRQRKPWRRDS